jgi:hypothetical protein
LAQNHEGFEMLLGFPEWLRGPARIDGGEVVLDEERAERYTPYNMDRAIFELAALGQQEQADIGAFVRRYGLLRRGPGLLGTGKCREPVSEWLKAIRIAWSAVHLYLKLREAARIGSADPVRALSINWTEAPETSTDKEYLMWRSILLAGLINAHLSQCPTALVPASSSEQGIELGAFVFTSRPPDLLTAAYADFATLVSRRAELKECPGCGVVFHPESGKQKYHDPSCAGAARWRRWKDRQAAEQAG